jgi:hypothetical protein
MYAVMNEIPDESFEIQDCRFNFAVRDSIFEGRLPNMIDIVSIEILFFG